MAHERRIEFSQWLPVRDALEAAITHLDYVGYGDSWERECAFEDNLPARLQEALDLADALLDLERQQWHKGGEDE